MLWLLPGTNPYGRHLLHQDTSGATSHAGIPCGVRSMKLTCHLLSTRPLHLSSPLAASSEFRSQGPVSNLEVGVWWPRTSHLDGTNTPSSVTGSDRPRLWWHPGDSARRPADRPRPSPFRVRGDGVGAADYALRGERAPEGQWLGGATGHPAFGGQVARGLGARAEEREREEERAECSGE